MSASGKGILGMKKKLVSILIGGALFATIACGVAIAKDRADKEKLQEILDNFHPDVKLEHHDELPGTNADHESYTIPEDILEQMEGAHPASQVGYNGETGETIFIPYAEPEPGSQRAMGSGGTRGSDDFEGMTPEDINPVH